MLRDSTINLALIILLRQGCLTFYIKDIPIELRLLRSIKLFKQRKHL